MLSNNGKGEHTGTPNNSLTFFSADQFTELFIHTWAHLGDDLILNIHNGIEVGHIENMIERRCGGNLFEFFCICSFDAFEKEQTWITNRDLLYGTWNSAQCDVAVWMEAEFGGENGHMYMYCCIPLLFTWNYHNIVNQQYPQYKIKFSKKGIGYLKGLSFKSGSNKRIHLQRRRPRFDPGLGRSPGERNDNPLQYSCSENPMVWGAGWATVHWVTKSRTRLSN